MGILKKQYFFVALLLVALIFGALLLWPFIKVIILSIALAVVLHPVYVFLNKRVSKNISWLSALLTVFFFLIVLCVPVFIIGLNVFYQSQDVYQGIVTASSGESFLDKVHTGVNQVIPLGSVHLEDRVADISKGITTAVGSLFSAVLSTIFSLLLVILSLFYFLKDGMHWRDQIIALSPLSNINDKKILHQLSDAVNGVMKGYLLIGAIQGVLMGVGLWIFGVPNPALWGVFAGIASLVPTIGTGLVAIPVILYLFSTGQSGEALGMLIWSSVLVGLVDNLLNPIIVGRRVNIHPLLILFAVLGGISLMGPIGILIGPLIISFIHGLISIHKSELAETS